MRLKTYKMAISILPKFLTLKWNISRTIWRIEVGDGSFFCIFYALSFALFFRPKVPFKVQLPLKNTTVGSSKNSNDKTDLFRWYRTTRFKAIAGLKQGCSLSPLLANIYLSDLRDHIKQNHNSAFQLHEKYVTSITWADDLLILSMQREGLQNCFDNLNTYTEEWVLQVFLKKTRCVIFSKRTYKP